MMRVRDGSFVITFDCKDDDIPAINHKILSAEFIASWWNQIPRVYVIETDLGIDDLYLKINNLFPTETYIMAPINGYFNGRLTFEKWKHLINLSQEELRRLEIRAAKEVARRQQENDS
ncbi:hypothetical protein EAH87_02575 [Sphingomonas koreensis]|nr:hypothetical protein EAH87_02575 [Sphingomonas koreensis]